MKLQGKTALVTGAGRGIGEAIADALAEQGAAVAVCDVDGAAAAKTAAGIAERHGGRAVGVTVDIADSDAVRAAADYARSELGPVDVLVNNAAIDVVESFLDNTEDTWDRIIAVNLRGTIAVTRAVLDQMIERKTGRIIHVAEVEHPTKILAAFSQDPSDFRRGPRCRFLLLLRLLQTIVPARVGLDDALFHHA